MVMNAAVEAAMVSLPLAIERVSWRDEMLSIGGPEWSFTTSAAWRLVTGGVIRPTDDLDEAQVEAVVQSFLGLKIVEITTQSTTAPIDPTFVLSSGDRLEIFSTGGWEPWVWRVPNGVFVASPSDPAQV
jgi:hypothetical protein